MEEAVCERQNALAFGENLFADLMSLHPTLCNLLPAVCKQRVSYYDSVIAKCVIREWYDIRNILKEKLRKDFPRFAQTEDTFKNYLKGIADLVLSGNDNVHNQVLGISAALLEVISFCYRRGMTDFIHYAPHYWLLMFDSINSHEFYEHGGWNALKLVAKKQAEDYDKNKDHLRTQYFSQSASTSEVSRSSSSAKSSEKFHAGDSTEVSSGEMTEESPPDEDYELPEAVKVAEKDVENKEQTLNDSTKEKTNKHGQSSVELRHDDSETVKGSIEEKSDDQEQRSADKRDIEDKTVKEPMEKKFDDQGQQSDDKRDIEDKIVKQSMEKKSDQEQQSADKRDIEDETVKEPTEKKSDDQGQQSADKRDIEDTTVKEPMEEKADDQGQQSADKRDIEDKIVKQSMEKKSDQEQQSADKRDIEDKAEKESMEKKSDDHEQPSADKRDIEDKTVKESMEKKSDDQGQQSDDKRDIEDKTVKQSMEKKSDQEQRSADKRDIEDETVKEPMEKKSNDQGQQSADKRDIEDTTEKEPMEKKVYDQGQQSADKRDIEDKIVKQSMEKKYDQEQQSADKIDIDDKAVKESMEKKSDDHEQPLADKRDFGDKTVKESMEKKSDDRKRSSDKEDSGEIVKDSKEDHPHHLQLPTAEMSKNGTESTMDVKESTKQKDSDRRRSPQDVTDQSVTTENLKAPPEEKHEMKDDTVKRKMHKVPKKDENLPTQSCRKDNPKIETPTSSHFSASKISTPKVKSTTPKMTKSGSTEDSPSFSKTPTNRGDVSKFQSKSCDRQEKSRRLSLTKPSPEVQQSSRRTASAKAKSTSKDPVPEGDKSEKKHLQPASSRTQASSQPSSVPKNSQQDSSTSTAGTSDSTPAATCAKHLNVPLPDAKTERSRLRKSHEIQSEKSASSSSTKSAKPAGASRGQNIQGKNTTKDVKDSKSEKPRWR